VKGFLLDEVAFMAPSYSHDDGEESKRGYAVKKELRYLQELDTLLQQPRIYLPPSQSTEEAAWRISRDDCSDYRPKDLAEYLAHEGRRRRGLRGGYLHDPDFAPIHRALRRELAPPAVFSGHPHVYRRLGRSKQGYVCQLPLDAKEGDMLAIFRGSFVPHVLRGTGDRADRGTGWILVGDAYVHGIMKGEELRESEKIIELR
jgi:hypothetical protein